MSQKRTRRPYVTGRDELDTGIAELLDRIDELPDRKREFGRQIMTTLFKMLDEGGSVGDLKMMNSVFKELRWAFKVFGPARSTRKVSVFGSARTKPEEAAYQQAVDFGAKMAAKGWGVITGAGDGIMGAAHGGAGFDKSYGVAIDLPFETSANEIVRESPKLVNFKYFFTRKLVFLKETDAIVLFPGGFGTHDEGFEALTLIQTGKAEPLPVIFVEPEGNDYWEEWHQYVLEHLEKPGMISPNDLCLYRVTDEVDDAIAEIDRFYRVYHSQRFVGQQLVMRLCGKLSEARLELVNEKFSHLLKDGRIEQGEAVPGENQPEIAHLTRLTLHYTRADAAGLRELIDFINDTPDDQVEGLGTAGPDPEEERADRGGMPEPDEPEDLDED